MPIEKEEASAISEPPSEEVVSKEKEEKTPEGVPE